VVLITGGGSGIGLELAMQYGLHGAKVAIMGRRQEVLEGAVNSLKEKGIDAMFTQGDVRDHAKCKQAVDRVVAKFGRLDTLINNAAGNFLANLADLTPNGFRTVIEIDLVGAFNMTHAAFPHLRDSKNGLILNITATMHYSATWFQAHPSAAKAGIDSLTRSIALEWGYYGIRANSIAPGPIADTAGLTKLAPAKAERQKQQDDMIRKHIPLGRTGTKFDIAMAAIYLSSDAGSYVTGDALIVDGGHWLYNTPNIPRKYVSEMSRAIEAKSRNTGLASSGKSKL